MWFISPLQSLQKILSINFPCFVFLCQRSWKLRVQLRLVEHSITALLSLARTPRGVSRRVNLMCGVRWLYLSLSLGGWEWAEADHCGRSDPAIEATFLPVQRPLLCTAHVLQVKNVQRHRIPHSFQAGGGGVVCAAVCACVSLCFRGKKWKNWIRLSGGET